MYTLDLDKLTGRELRDINRATGLSLAVLFDDDGPHDFERQIVLYWIARRRQEPGYTYDQALDETLDAYQEIEVSGEVGAQPDPTDAAS